MRIKRHSRWSTGARLGLVLLASLLLARTTDVSAQQWPAPAGLATGAARPPKDPHRRLDSVLNRVVASVPRIGERAAAETAPLSRETSVAVTIQLADASVPAVALLAARGAIVANIDGNLVEAYVPVRELAGLDQLPGVVRVRAIVPPQPLVISQGRTVHNAAAWNSAGFTGAGVKVGIIDVGFIGYSALIGTELPSPAAVRCYTSVGVFTSNLANCQNTTNHGTGVAEAVIDMAPGASLYVSQPWSWSDLLSTAQWMVSQGVTVINHSAGWTWAGPGDGTSPYSNSPLAAVNAAVAGGSLWVNAAGNEAQATWTGSYQDQDADTVLEFASGVELNALYLTAGEQVFVQARWQDAWGTATRDIDLYLLDSVDVVAYSQEYQDGSPGSTPYEWIVYTAPFSGTYYVALVNYLSPSLPGWLQVQNFTNQSLTYRSAAYSIANPAESSNPGALAVGATPWYNTSTIEWFSSQGPTIDGRTKPEITGVDRGDSSTYGAGGFAGTSQAAPHVAGLAALVRGRYSSFTPMDVANYLKSNAQPRGSPVPNNTWGWGLAYLPTPPCTFNLSATGVTVGAAGGPGSVTLTTNCAWTAVSNAGWITITGGSSGSGNGVISFNVASNVTYNAPSPQRVGTITIAGLTFTVTQQGCGFVLSPPSAIFDVAGGAGAFGVTTGSACSWAAGSSAGWIAVTGGSPGTGSGQVTFTVASNAVTNTTTPQRTGSIVVAGSSFTVTQSGCGFSVTPAATTFDAGGGTGAVEIIVGNGCGWTIGSLPAWASTTSGASGSGAGRWTYGVDPNGTGNSRSAIASVAGQPFTLTQLAVPVRPIVAGGRLLATLADSSAERWTSLETVAGRSYCLGVSPAPSETLRATPALAAFRANGSTPLATGASESTTLPAGCFIAPSAETALFRLTQAEGSARNYLLSAQETTLWSNWFFIGGDYSSFTLLRNATSNPVSALITWRDASGAAVGQESVVVAARGISYRDARQKVTPGVTAGTVEVAFNGPPSALVGSQTTLSATTGLSFDTLLRARVPW